MANRNYASGGKMYSMHVKPVMVDVVISIGATGAVSSKKGAMVDTVTRLGTGLYKIKMQPSTSFNRLFSAQGSMRSPVSGLSGIVAIEIQNAPDASVALVAAGELTIKTIDAAGALADPDRKSVV